MDEAPFPIWFTGHEDLENLRFNRLEDGHNELKENNLEIIEKLNIIKENHLAHLQVSYGKLEGDVKWVKWFVMLLIGESTVLILGALFKLLLK